MSDKTLIIIGAGLAGLSAGCYAQMNGYQSQIFEHHALPGGVAAAWKRGDYFIDGGIHFVMSHKPGTGLYELYRQLGIVPANRFLDLPAFGRFIHEASGRSVFLGQSLTQWESELKALSPGDARVVDELIAGARAMQGLDMSQVGLSKPPGLASTMDQIKELWAMRRLFRYVIGRYAQPVARYARTIQDPVLRACVERLFLPEVPVYFLCMLMGLLADGEIGLIEGGSHDFVRAIEERYSALGGKITYQATVEKILVEKDLAVGVRLADGTEHHADTVISAADGRSTIYQLLGGIYVNEKIEKRYATWKTFQPLLMLSYGVAQEFPNEPPFATILLQEPLTIGPQAVDGIMIRFFNYSSRFAPPGKTVVQVEMETQWAYWNDLRTTDRTRYDTEKERVAVEVLQRLVAHYPGISSKVEVTDVSTPYTTWRYTLNHEGAWEGWLITPEVMWTAIERTLPGLANFYMAGQWVMPGGGVPSCLFSGRHAVQLLCQRDGIPFSAASP